jgi:hypothetical protein
MHRRKGLHSLSAHVVTEGVPFTSTAGRDEVHVDEEIARRLFPHSVMGVQGEPRFSPPIPPYSTDIAAAWKVVETIRRRNLVVRIEAIGERYYCEVVLRSYSVMGIASTAPAAICEAVLEALDVEESGTRR